MDMADSSKKQIIGDPPGSQVPPATQNEALPLVEMRTSTRKPKREREKKTILFEPARAKWLEIQTATEWREMSDIVAEALGFARK
jgi:hypothetical protein